MTCPADSHRAAATRSLGGWSETDARNRHQDQPVPLLSQQVYLPASEEVRQDCGPVSGQARTAERNLMTTPSEVHTPLPEQLVINAREPLDLVVYPRGEGECGFRVARIVTALVRTDAEGEALAVAIRDSYNERPKLLERVRVLEEALRKARVAIATWSPDPTEPLEEIDAALKAE